MLNNFVNFELLFTKPSGIHPYKNALNNQVGMIWRHVFLACSKLEARGHLLHITGNPPKHFSRECTMYIAEVLVTRFQSFTLYAFSTYCTYSEICTLQTLLNFSSNNFCRCMVRLM